MRKQVSACAPLCYPILNVRVCQSTSSVFILVTGRKFFAVNLLLLGNHWFNRKKFVKQAGKFYPLDIDYGQVRESI